MLLLRLFGLLLLRYAHRKLFSLVLFHAPPRTIWQRPTPFYDDTVENDLPQAVGIGMTRMGDP